MMAAPNALFHNLFLFFDKNTCILITAYWVSLLYLVIAFPFYAHEFEKIAFRETMTSWSYDCKKNKTKKCYKFTGWSGALERTFWVILGIGVILISLWVLFYINVCLEYCKIIDKEAIIVKGNEEEENPLIE